MSDPINYDRRGYALDVARDVLAVVLMVLMVVGLAWAGFATDWRIGLSVVSLATGALGFALGMTRT